MHSSSPFPSSPSSPSSSYFGITGKYGVGKDTVAQILQENGFIHLSLSDALRDHLKSRNIPITRDSMIQYGDELRAKEGSDILAKTVMKQLQPNQNYVFSSIRSLGELQHLQTLSNFILIEVTAPITIRLYRLQQRNRPGDPQTLPKLLIKEQQEQTNDPAGMQLNDVISQAQYQIANDSTVEELRKRIKEMLEKVSKK
ncbi:AAA family ATPase [Candidatus Woesearchaeota archaeon]|nr:AAA family ATPase [Candidatus Woesearchaeota archaeon]